MRPPAEILSDALQQRIAGRTVETAVFLTFRFDPGFFEQEILPVLMDVPSQAPAVKLLMLEDALRDRMHQMAVYYDRNGLEAGATSAKLDVRRIPITQNGFFHPKNVLLLVRPEPTDQDRDSARSLIVATMSANLTRAGWWENVEICQIEEISSGDKSSLRDDVCDLIRRLKQVCRAEDRHEALDEIAEFLRRETIAYAHATHHGTLRPRLYAGSSSVPDFLEDVLGDTVEGWNLEIISPYFDATTAAPLSELIERFAPREVRVLLPRDAGGVALCEEAYWQTVLDLADTTATTVQWGSFPRAMLTTGKGASAFHRRVHAKSYRFFRTRPGREIHFVGSVNLTSAGHSRGGNFETAILVESETRQPAWWLEPDLDRPIGFEREVEGEQSPSARLGVRFHWHHNRAAVFWDSDSASPPIVVTANGPELFSLDPLRPREWLDLTEPQSDAIRARLEQSSFLTVRAGDDPAADILVQEEAMAHKPSLIVTLPIEDILRYWALLTPEQKAAFLETRVRDLVENGLSIPTAPLGQISSMFSTFAGIFQAFGSLRQRLDDAFDHGRDRQVEYYLFGKRYDSLHALLERAQEADQDRDPVILYVVALAAKQLVGSIRRQQPEFAREHGGEFRALDYAIRGALKVRNRLDIPRSERKEFLGWFENWFVREAAPVPSTVDD